MKVSETTCRIVSGWVDVEETGQFAVDDNTTIAVFDLHHVLRRRRKTETSPLVGRDRELAQLVAALEAARAGTGSAHLLVGPAGVGKSRLAAEVADIASRCQLRILDWHINPIRPVGTPEPLQDLVADLIDRELPEHRYTLEKILVEHGLRGPAAAALTDFVLPAQRRQVEMTIDAMLALVAEGVATLVEAVAHRRPMLLLIDDLHLAGSDVAAAVRGIVERCRTPLVLITSREGMPDAPEGLTTTPVQAFDPQATQVLVDSLLGDAPGLERVKRTLIERSGGNPYFLVELVRGMVAERLLEGTDGRYRVGRDGAGRLPETLQALLVARIDRLPEFDRQIILTAAVVGPIFDSELLGGVLNLGQDTTAAALSRLIAWGFMDNTRLLPRQEYSFRHALLHEAAYNTLTKKDRRQLHQSLVALLESADFADLPGRLATLARHAFHGELWAKAVETGRAAGTDAFSRCLAAEGLELFSRAVDAHGQLPEDQRDKETALELRMLLARTYMMLGEPEKSARLLESMADLAAVTGAITWPPKIYWLLGSANLALGRIADAFLAGKKAMEFSAAIESNGTPHFEVLATYAASLVEKGDFILAEQILNEAFRQISGEGGLKHKYMRLNPQMVINTQLARCACEFGARQQVEQHFSEAWSAVANGNHPFDQIYYFVYRAECMMNMDDPTGAKRSADSALQFIEMTGANMFMSYARAISGAASVSLGEHDVGIGEINAALRECHLGARVYEGAILLLLAESHFKAGDITSASEVGQRCLAATVQSGAQGTGARALELIGRCHLARGEVQAARRIVVSARSRARELGMGRLQGQCDVLMECMERSGQGVPRQLDG